MIRKGVVLTPADFNGVDWISVMKANGLNTLGLHSGGGAAHDNVIGKLGDFASDTFRKQVTDAGLDIEYELHAPCDLLPRTLFADHPEYFIQPFGSSERNSKGNWCPMNREALALVAQNGARLATRLAPSTHRHFYWGDDVADGSWCHCHTCSVYSATDQTLLSVNAIAEQLPEETFGFLSYFQTLPAPEFVRPRPNVILEYAPLRRCYDHAINDPTCEINRRHWQMLKQQLAFFDASRGHILEYWLDSSRFSGWKKPAQKPRVRRDIVEADIKAYYSLGFRSFTTFAVYMDGEYFQNHGDQELKDYAAILNSL